MDAIPRYLSPVSTSPAAARNFWISRCRKMSSSVFAVISGRKKNRRATPKARYTHYLRCLVETENGFVDQLTGQDCDYDYELDARREFAVWQDQWAARALSAYPGSTLARRRPPL